MVTLFDCVQTGVIVIFFFFTKAKKILGLYKRDETSKWLSLTVESCSSLTLQSNTCSASIAPNNLLSTPELLQAVASALVDADAVISPAATFAYDIDLIKYDGVEDTVWPEPLLSSMWGALMIFCFQGLEHRSVMPSVFRHCCWVNTARTLSYRPSGCAGVPSSFTSQAQQLIAETKRKLLAKAEGLVTEVQHELSTIRVEMGLLQKKVADGNLWDF